VDVERLRRLELFGDLDYHDLAEVARWVDEVQVAPGDLLIEEGALPYELFVIEEGTAEVERGGEVVAKIGPGETVGEMALVLQERRAASVRATTPIRALAISVEEFQEMAEEMPEIASQIRATTERRRRENQAGR
jgi:CRP/FNR family transcriptional regulator, cyclic AMP receptor protein